MSRQQTKQVTRLSRRAALRAGAGTGLVLAVGATGTRAHEARGQAATIRWDLISVEARPPAAGGNILSPGGRDSAKAETGEEITLTGTGTFNPGSPRSVTGGGTYTIRDPQGAVMGSGTYRVTELCNWHEAPGRQSPPIVDRIGAVEDGRAGLAVLRIAYSDGNEGTLVVSCRIPGPAGAPPQIFEGIVASHAFVFFWNHGVAQAEPFVDANRTLFHVARGPAALPATGDGSATDAEDE